MLRSRLSTIMKDTDMREVLQHFKRKTITKATGFHVHVDIKQLNNVTLCVASFDFQVY